MGIFGLTSVLFATVVEFYWKFHKLHILRNRKIFRKSIVAAFNCLDAHNIGTVNFVSRDELTGRGQGCLCET